MYVYVSVVLQLSCHTSHHLLINVCHFSGRGCEIQQDDLSEEFIIHCWPLFPILPFPVEWKIDSFFTFLRLLSLRVKGISQSSSLHLLPCSIRIDSEIPDVMWLFTLFSEYKFFSETDWDDSYSRLLSITTYSMCYFPAYSKVYLKKPSMPFHASTNAKCNCEKQVNF